MKKVLLATLASTAIATSAFAGGDYYVGASAGVAMFGKEKDKVTSSKMKSNNGAHLSAAFGYKVMDNFRTELALGYHASPELKKGTVKHKLNVSSLMVRGLFDVADVDFAKFFVGAGVGAAKVSEKVTTTGVTNLKSKDKTNAAFNATVGAGFDLADGVVADLAYNYYSYGQTKSRLSGTTEVAKTRLNAHVASVGVRFCL